MVEAFIPLPKQYVFATCNSARYRFFGGAAGGSKSRLAVEMNKARAMMFPGTQHIVFRRKTRQLAPLIREAKNVIPHRLQDGKDRLATINQSDRAAVFTFIKRDPVHGESTITFSHMHLDENAEDHLGPSYTTITFDESTTFTEEQISLLETRLRTDVEGVEPLFLMFSNPIGVSHVQTMRKFLEPRPEDVMEVTEYFPWDEGFQLWLEIKARYPMMETQDRESIREASQEWIMQAERRGIIWREYDNHTRENKKSPDPYDVWRAVPTESQRQRGVQEGHLRVFIPSRLEDNPYFGRDYLIQLAANKDPRLVQAYLDGDWHIFEGQFFREFDENRHVIDPIIPKPGWPIFGSMDHGYSERSRTAIYWHTINPDTRQIITFDELTMNQTEDTEIARRILARHPDLYIDYIAADPAMWKGVPEGGRTIGDRYVEWGVPLRPANNQRVEGWRICRTVLPNDVDTGEPRWVVTRNCRYLIETLPAAVEDDKKFGDISKESDDHGLDAWRYGMVSVDNHLYGNVGEPVGVGIYQPGVVGGVQTPEDDWAGDWDKPFLTMDDLRS